MSIFSILAVFLVSSAGVIGSTWQRGIAYGERRSAALAVFDRISRDLRSAALPLDVSNKHLRFSIDPLDTDGNPLISADFRNPQSVFWQGPVATDRSKGELALVGYFVRWVGKTPKFCRVLINPSYPDYPLYQTASQLEGDWVSDTLLNNYAAATATAGYSGELAENVLGFWIQALNQNMQPIKKDAKDGAFLPNGTFDSRRGYICNSKTYPNALPAAVEIAVVTVDRRTAQRLSGNEKPGPRSENMWDDLNAFYAALPQAVKQGAEIHSCIIDITNAPR